MHRAAAFYQAGNLDAFYETLTVASFRGSRISVSLANPSLPDVPLIGVSQGFEQMTGYSRSEIIGRNCRFLSSGCHVPADVRHQMRCLTKTDKWFRGILVNRRKNGEFFKNLLHMCWMKVGNSLYILGLQADVTHADVDLSIEDHMQEMDRLVNAVFAANVDAWAALQISNFASAKLETFSPYVETHLLQQYTPQDYEEARAAFVLLTPIEEDSCTRVRAFNTFIEVDSRDGQGPLLSRLRRNTSEPALGSREVADMPRIPADILRESVGQLGGSPLPGLSAALAVSKKQTDEEEVELQSELHLASVGSALHPDGCKPCSFFCYSQMGCNRGELCTYCHMDHPKRARRRGKKKQKGSIEGRGESSMETPSMPQHLLLMPTPPAPTPLGLVPLLDALELLSPLPYEMDEIAPPEGEPPPTRLVNRGEPPPTSLASRGSPAGSEAARRGGAVEPQPIPCAIGRPGSSDDRTIDEAAEGQELPGRSCGTRSQMSLCYNEESIIVARGQWKQVIPFISGAPGRLTFAIFPLLPRGLSLRRHSGVISGVAMQLTPSEGVVHRITAEGATGQGSTFLHVLVVDPNAVVERPHEEEDSLPGGLHSALVSSEEE